VNKAALWEGIFFREGTLAAQKRPPPRWFQRMKSGRKNPEKTKKNKGTPQYIVYRQSISMIKPGMAKYNTEKR